MPNQQPHGGRLGFAYQCHTSSIYIKRSLGTGDHKISKGYEDIY